MKVGAFSAFFIALFFVIIAITYFLIPAENQVSRSQFGSFLQMLNRENDIYIVQMWLLALTSVLAIPVIISVQDLFKEKPGVLLRSASVFGFIGHAIIMMTSLSAQTYMPKLAKTYGKASPMVQSAIVAVNIELNDWSAFSLVGIWFITISLIFMRKKQLSIFLSVIGLLIGISYLFIGQGIMAENDILVSIAIVTGCILLGPVWYVCIGIKFLRSTH